MSESSASLALLGGRKGLADSICVVYYGWDGAILTPLVYIGGGGYDIPLRNKTDFKTFKAKP